jgi:hypothetical protein
MSIRLVRVIHSSLLGTFIRYEKWSIVNMMAETVYTTLHFLHNLKICPISLCVTLHSSGKACQGQTLKHIAPISKLWRKWIVANMTPWTVFITLHFLSNLQMGPLSWIVCLRLVKLFRDKHPSLYSPFMSYEENEVLWIRPQFNTLEWNKPYNLSFFLTTKMQFLFHEYRKFDKNKFFNFSSEIYFVYQWPVV